MNDAVYTLSDSDKEFAQKLRQNRVSSKETSSVWKYDSGMFIQIYL